MKKAIKALWCTFDISVLIFVASVFLLKSTEATWRVFSITMPVAGISLWGAIILTTLDYVRWNKEKNEIDMERKIGFEYVGKEMNRMEEIMEQIILLSTSVTKEEYNTCLEQGYDLLEKLHELGADKDSVYQTLSGYFSSLEDGLSYDFMADVLDFVVGFCSPERHIWSD